MIAFKRISAYLLLPLCFISSCSAGDGPFLTVQMCLIDENGLSVFVDRFRAIAAARGMNYVDRSVDSQQELEALNYVGMKNSRGMRIVHISAAGADGFTFGATNLELSQHQVIVGFSAGTDEVKAHRFAAEVVADFKRRWKVFLVRDNAGPIPMKGCR